MSELPSLAHRVAAIRRFGRFYTGAVGMLREGLHDTRFSLTEARVLYELASRPGRSARDIAQELGLDSGYLSRILQRFARDGLLHRERSAMDARQTMLTLTDAGRAAFAPLDDASAREVATLLAPLPEPAQAALVGAMGRIETLLGATAPARPWLIRPPRAGDIGWVVARHGALYAEEYRFDARFEALVAKVAGAFLEKNDPMHERCWIAERDGVNVGSIFLVRADDETAKLRLLLVEPAARGAGVGRRLLTECLDFARAAGYRRVVLWTNDVLAAARHLYLQAGFRLVASTPHRNFGPAIVGEDWVLDLTG